jgi:hypothetical protein
MHLPTDMLHLLPFKRWQFHYIEIEAKQRVFAPQGFSLDLLKARYVVMS